MKSDLLLSSLHVTCSKFCRKIKTVFIYLVFILVLALHLFYIVPNGSFLTVFCARSPYQN